MSSGSYKTSSFSQDIADEIRRLGVQVDLFWPEERTIYESISLPVTPRILEIGSGPGFYIKKLASLFPEASFVSLEYDSTFTNYQQDLFGDGLANRIEVVCENILTVEDLGEFDLVVSRMVLEHLPDPIHVFEKMNAFVKVGGTFLLLDNDFANHLRTYPPVVELEALYKAYCNLRVEEQGNPYIGRELPRFFSMAGYENIQFQTVCAHTCRIDKSLFLGAESSAIGITLVKKGYLKEDVFKRLIINWSRMAHDANNVMIRELYCAYGTKTSASADFEARTGTEKIATLQVKKPHVGITDSEMIPPESEVEKQIAGIWCELLNVERVGIENSFFDIGGESYMVPLVVDALENRFGFKVEITDIFEYPTIKGLASYLSNEEKNDTLDDATSTAIRQKSAISQNTSNNPFARLKKR